MERTSTGPSPRSFVGSWDGVKARTNKSLPERTGPGGRPKTPGPCPAPGWDSRNTDDILDDCERPTNNDSRCCSHAWEPLWSAWYSNENTCVSNDCKQKPSLGVDQLVRQLTGAVDHGVKLPRSARRTAALNSSANSHTSIPAPLSATSQVPVSAIPPPASNPSVNGRATDLRPCPSGSPAIDRELRPNSHSHRWSAGRRFRGPAQ